MNWNPVLPVFAQSCLTPQGLALFADGIELSYGQLAGCAGSLAAALQRRGISRGSRVGILGSRSLLAIQAVLGVSWCGAGVCAPESTLASGAYQGGRVPVESGRSNSR